MFLACLEDHDFKFVKACLTNLEAISWTFDSWHTVWCRYDAVNFLQNSHNRHPIARPWGRGMGCLLWVWSLIYVLLLPLQCHIQYRDKFDRVITALDQGSHGSPAMKFPDLFLTFSWPRSNFYWFLYKMKIRYFDLCRNSHRSHRHQKNIIAATIWQEISMICHFLCLTN